MGKNARDTRPYIRPVHRIELSDQNVKARWIAIALCLTIAIMAFGYGFYSALSTEPGWQKIQPTVGKINCSNDFVLMYDIGAGDADPTAQYKHLVNLYGELTVSAYHLFSPDAVGEDNLYHVNAHVNEAVTVAPGLYNALKQIAASESRHPYMGPVQSLYNSVFFAPDDVIAALYDPLKDPELADLAREMAAYCSDPAMIWLEDLGNNQIRLNVADAYLAFAREQEVSNFLDLGWMTNGFIIDYMAEALRSAGHCYGYLASYDGFTRNLDVREESYSVNLFHRVGNDIWMPARLNYPSPMSLVSLRDYPLTDQDKLHCYSYADGSITTAYLDPMDGMSKSTVDSLMGYSEDMGCAAIALALAPVYTADAFTSAELSALAEKGIQTLWYDNQILYHTQEDASLELLPESGGEGYQFQLAR